MHSCSSRVSPPAASSNRGPDNPPIGFFRPLVLVGADHKSSTVKGTALEWKRLACGSSRPGYHGTSAHCRLLARWSHLNKPLGANWNRIWHYMGKDTVRCGLLTGSVGRELVAHEGSLHSSALWATSDFVWPRAGRGHPLGCSVLVLFPRRHGEQPVRREGAGRPVGAPMLPRLRLFFPSADIRSLDSAAAVPAVFCLPGTGPADHGGDRGETAGGRSPPPDRRQIPAGFGRRSGTGPKVRSSPSPDHRHNSRAGVVQSSRRSHRFRQSALARLYRHHGGRGAGLGLEGCVSSGRPGLERGVLAIGFSFSRGGP